MSTTNIKGGIKENSKATIRSSNPPTSSNVTLVFTPSGSASARAKKGRQDTEIHDVKNVHASPILPKFDGVPATAARSLGIMPPAPSAPPKTPPAAAPKGLRGVRVL